MTEIEERLEIKAIHNQRLLIAIAGALLSILLGPGKGYSAEELKRAMKEAQPWRE